MFQKMNRNMGRYDSAIWRNSPNKDFCWKMIGYGEQGLILGFPREMHLGFSPNLVSLAVNHGNLIVALEKKAKSGGQNATLKREPKIK